MPFMSDKDLAIIKTTLQRKDEEIEKCKSSLKVADLTTRALSIGEGLGGAAAVGYLRGKHEDPATGQWNVPGTTLDVEMLIVAGLAGVALAGEALGLEKFQTHAANICAGVGGHYAGQLGRNMARTGKFALVAGTAPVGSSLPQYDPNSFNPTQTAAPYDDPVAESLAQAGV